MWRIATKSDNDAIVALSRALYIEDPAVAPVPDSNTLATLAALRAEPARGKAVVLELDSVVAGYAFLISFWSNELGGEVCVIDELYVQAAHRRRGHARALFRQLQTGSALWTPRPVALELEVTPQNERAAGLYAHVGFIPIKNARLRLVL
jgi:ribosomal protein S18 acetylase RimI-like enzyme